MFNKKLLKLITLLVMVFTFIWLSSFMFRVLMSISSDGFLKTILTGNFTLSTQVRSHPFDIFHYYQNYKDVYPTQLKYAWIISAAAHLVLALIISKLMTEKRSLYGDARFATVKEIEKEKLFIPAKDVKKDGLFAGSQIIVGKLNNRYIGLGGQQFAYLAAPTRSGKGVGVVIPVGLSYDHSMVVLDIKQELFEITAAYRAKCGQSVFLFNPFDTEGRTDRWNPLSYVSRSEQQRVDDINQIAICLIPDTGGDDTFFEESARKLFIGLGLYCLDKEKAYKQEGIAEFVPTIKEILDLATDFSGDAIPHFSSLMNDAFVSTLARQTINSAVSAGEKTFASILATLTANLTTWLSQPVVDATSGDDFDLRDVRKKRMTIYIGIQPKDLNKAKKIINLFYSQLINENTSERPESNEDLKYQCLMLMDEGTAPGKIEVLEKAVSYMAGYNMRMLFIAQSPAQLKDNKVYGENGCRNILTNIALKILFKPNDVADSEEYSKMLGKITVNENTSKSRGGGNKGVSQTETQNQRDLMMPQELRAMSKEKEIIIFEGISYPILADKNFYYKDPTFIKRYKGHGVPKVIPLAERLGIEQASDKNIREDTKDIKLHGENLKGKLSDEIKSSVKMTILKNLVSNAIQSNIEVEDGDDTVSIEAAT